MGDPVTASSGKSSTNFYIVSLTGAAAALKKGDPAGAKLTLKQITVGAYQPPPPTIQRQADISRLPLADCINRGNASCPFINIPGVNQTEALIDTGLSTYSPAWDGKNIWALQAVVDPATEATVVRYYIIDSKKLTLTKEGTIAAPYGNSLIMPAVAVNGKGKTGVVVFTLVGPDFWPSAAFAVIQGGAVKPTIYVAALAPGPSDSFSGYSVFSAASKTPVLSGVAAPAPTATARWGDYSAARLDEKGNFWFATEYIDQVGGPLGQEEGRTHSRGVAKARVGPARGAGALSCRAFVLANAKALPGARPQTCTYSQWVASLGVCTDSKGIATRTIDLNWCGARWGMKGA
jgi:hypothetical protein